MAAGVLCSALAIATAVRLPVFFGGDERMHFGYVVYLLEGKLPEVQDPLPTADEQFPILARAEGRDEVPAQHTSDSIVNVANHPPLLYVTAAPLTWMASEVGDETLPPLVLRVFNGLFMGAGVVLTGLLARELFPRASGIGVLAAGLAAVTPNIVGVAAYGHNDGLAFALAAGALLVIARLLRQGPTTRLVIAAAALAAACALTRASLLVAAAGLVAAPVLGGLRHHRARGAELSPSRGSTPLDGHGGLASAPTLPPRQSDDLVPEAPGPGLDGAPAPAAGGVRASLHRRLWPGWRPWGSAAVVAASVALLAGWFYVRNQRLYGSPTADELLLDTFERVPRGSLTDVLREGEFHRTMWSKVYGSVHPHLVFFRAEQVVIALATLALIGGAATLWHRARAPYRAVDVTSPVLPGIGGVGWLLLAGYGGSVVVSVADFVSKGGSMHPRYFFGLVPLTSTLLAGAITALPWRRVLGLAAVGGLLAVTLSQLEGYSDLIAYRQQAGILALTERPAGPAVHWMLLGLAVLAAAVLAVELLRRPQAMATSEQVELASSS